MVWILIWQQKCYISSAIMNIITFETINHRRNFIQISRRIKKFQKEKSIINLRRRLNLLEKLKFSQLNIKA
jgi:trehalose-6-phosphate synthase